MSRKSSSLDKYIKESERLYASVPNKKRKKSPKKKKPKKKRKPVEKHEYTADTLPPFSERPMIVTLLPPYPKVHPVVPERNQ